MTNLNIFSSTLSIEEMKSITGGESCLKEGDYLAWEDMEWILHGQASIETVEKENTCQAQPFLTSSIVGSLTWTLACITVRTWAQEFLL